MLDTKQRNRKIFHMIKSAIHDFCKVLGCSYYCREESIVVHFEDEDLFHIYPEFHKDDYNVNIVCMVYQDLGMSKTVKLKDVYKTDEVAEFIDEAGSCLWFMDDTRLVMSCVERSAYNEYAILKSKLLLGIYANVQNARLLKDKLEVLLVDLGQVSIN